jgi:hypothetical protein
MTERHARSPSPVPSLDKIQRSCSLPDCGLGEIYSPLIIHALRLRFDTTTTTTALNFLSMISDEVRKAVVAISIAGCVRAIAMPCMNLLADCRD